MATEINPPEPVREIAVVIRKMSDGDWSIIPASERDATLKKAQVLTDFFKEKLNIDSSFVGEKGEWPDGTI